MHENQNLDFSEVVMSIQLKKIIFFLIFLSQIFLENNFAQATRSHEIGPLWETMFSSGSIPNYAPLQNQMTYPGGDYRTMTRKNLEGLGIWIGLKIGLISKIFFTILTYPKAGLKIRRHSNLFIQFQLEKELEIDCPMCLLMEPLKRDF